MKRRINIAGAFVLIVIAIGLTYLNLMYGFIYLGTLGLDQIVNVMLI
ncbi:hypothetical protein [Enterococcus sp. AZ072]